MANSASSKRTGLRKLPTQARSRERVADILKATGALLGEVGYDGLSTNLIAERAKVPVGSIYQFFETKDDIVAALVEQFQDRHPAAGERETGRGWRRTGPPGVYRAACGGDRGHSGGDLGLYLRIFRQSGAPAI